MRAHAEAIRDRLELLLLFMDAVASAPPPGLMHERPVRRVHEPNDSMINAAGQVGGKIRRLVFLRKSRQLRGCERRFVAARESCASRAGIGNEDPDKAVALLAGEVAGVDTIDFQV